MRTFVMCLTLVVMASMACGCMADTKVRATSPNSGYALLASKMIVKQLPFNAELLRAEFAKNMVRKHPSMASQTKALKPKK